MQMQYTGKQHVVQTVINVVHHHPSIQAGDRSLANVVAHELSHSWTGNLVTNENWEEFW